MIGIGAIFVFGVILDHPMIVANPLDARGRLLGIAASLAVIVVGSYMHWTFRKDALTINWVAIGNTGFYPPFKPKERLTKDDWFVPYRDIASMEPVDARLGDFVPAYDVTLRDGLTFQVNALDLLVYVDEEEVRRFARLLALIREEIMRPENRERAGRGEDITIPRESFEAAMK